ncbi:small ribosomal subunit protein mS40 [Danio rerio]|uniref:Small ribosomal subunit protein mS40 n=1 Tax=Danio rerio TaxID=7955 RepID=Q566S7_DANRE|nr:28S ribosomal protein S18b, mitochondrial [Danio rerio]AAH93356.1 Mitochondrial ribosomal protein S18B [Danio rerio]AAI65094.1 Mrps18b protein [Danio rerio]|eukprot:NP_001017759.1 28S ribosomal protein S18b, mitochondrial [Danio rerio]
MAASLQRIGIVACRTFPVNLQRHLQAQRIRDVRITSIVAPVHRVNYCASSSSADNTNSAETLSRYADTPWEYLKSEEYIERYGTKPVWTNYRRNHKGGIPPQKTRKTCIRGDKKCANPCPICRDPNIIIHYKNVNLLQQFFCPETGVVHDPTVTGVCMKQQKLLSKAIETAKDFGLLRAQFAHVDFTKEDYSNTHGAVTTTPPPFPLSSGELWYSWYGSIKPDERELARVKRIYKDYLKPEV